MKERHKVSCVEIFIITGLLRTEYLFQILRALLTINKSNNGIKKDVSKDICDEGQQINSE